MDWRPDAAGISLPASALRAAGQNGHRPRRGGGVAWRLFVTCWMLYALHFATNTVRELFPVLALGDRLSFDVSDYVDFHPDIFEIPGRGAFINNNPGASILGAIPYSIARPAVDRIVDRVQHARAEEAAPTAEYRTIYPMARDFVRKARERGLDVKFGLAAAITQTFLMAPLSALSVVAMWTVLRPLTGSTMNALWLAALYGFATPLLYRTAQLNQNLLLGHFAFFAFVLLWRPWDAPARPRRPAYLLAGLLTGWTVVLDYSGVVSLFVLSVYAVARRRALPPGSRSARDLWEFMGAAMAAVSVLLVYQWSAFGHPLWAAQAYMPAATFSHHGYHGMTWPQLDLLAANAFSIRYGLFTSAPILLAALAVPAWFDRRALIARRETLCVLAFSALFFLFTAANQYARMQFNSGVRHIVPVTPFLFLLAAGALVRLPAIGAALVGIGATYWSWCLAMYRDVEQGLGVFESLVHITLEGFRLPWLSTLERMGYVPAGASPGPLLVVTAAVVWTLWATRLTRPARQTPSGFGPVPEVRR
jgi:hypothetical protein